MNLPSFRKGEVLRAADLQALSDAVAAVNGSSRYVPGERGAPPEKFLLRTPIRDSGDGRIIQGHDNPAFTCGGEDLQGALLATAYGYIAGPTTKFCEMKGKEQQRVSGTHSGFAGRVWQTLCIDRVGRVIKASPAYAGAALCSRWWGDASENGSECSGMLTYLLGCVRCNPCASIAAPDYMRYYFRRHQQLPIPHITVNACMSDCTVPLVMRHHKDENVSRVRRLRAGEGVCLECCENFILMHARGLRPINPQGCWCGCGCEGETAAGGCTPACGCCTPACGCCTPAKPVQLVGCEYPAGAPTGVIIRQLVGRAGATVRRSVCMSCTVEVVSKVPVNVCANDKLQLVTPECYWTCCTVPIRRIEAASGLRGEETADTVRLWADLSVKNCTAGPYGDNACTCSGGWVLTFFQPAPLPDDPCLMYCYQLCGTGARRQLMRYTVPDPYSGGLQIVNQVKKNGEWLREE